MKEIISEKFVKISSKTKTIIGSHVYRATETWIYPLYDICIGRKFYICSKCQFKVFPKKIYQYVNYIYNAT